MNYTIYINTTRVFVIYNNLYNYIFYVFLQIDLPDSVTERWGHSLSAFIMGPYCVWLVVIGGAVNDDVDVKDPNMMVELGMSFKIILNTKLTNLKLIGTCNNLFLILYKLVVV